MKDKVLATSQKKHPFFWASFGGNPAPPKKLFFTVFAVAIRGWLQQEMETRECSVAHPVANGMKHSVPDWSLWFLSWKKRDNLWDEIQINLFENFPSTRNFPLFSLTGCWVSENLVYSMESEWEPTRSSAVWATLVLSSSLPGLKHICSANGYFNVTYSYVVKTTF